MALPAGADRLTLLARVAALLEDRHVGYAVIGGAAMAVHGVLRSTADLDVFTLDAPCLQAAAWDALGPDVGVTIRAGDETDPLAGVVRFRMANEVPVDLIVGRSSWQRGVVERAEPAVIEGRRVPVAGRCDLILLKLYAGGPLDAWDVEQLLAAGDRARIIADVEAALGALPDDARRLWSRLRG